MLEVVEVLRWCCVFFFGVVLAFLVTFLAVLEVFLGAGFGACLGGARFAFVLTRCPMVVSEGGVLMLTG